MVIRRTFSVMRAFLSAFLLYTSCVALWAEQGPGNFDELITGHSTSVLLTPEHDATLRLNLTDSKAEEIFLDTAVPDIFLRIVSSDGVEIQSRHIATFGWSVVPVATGGNRQVQVFLSAKRPVDGLKGVRVRLEPLSISLNTLPEADPGRRPFRLRPSVAQIDARE